MHVWRRLFVVVTSMALVLTVAGATSADRPSLPRRTTDPAAIALAEEYGLDTSSLEIQSDGQGARFLVDARGRYIMQFPTEESTEKAKRASKLVPLSSAWSAGVCWGSFTPLTRLNGNITWGGSNTCSASSPLIVYPHYIVGKLRATCAGSWPFCGVYSDEAGPFASNNSRYSNVANLYVETRCDTAENYRFENNLKVYVRGVEYGPFATPGGTVVPCNVTA